MCCDGVEGATLEWAQYLAQLVLRVNLGASFMGRFFLKSPGSTPLDCVNPGQDEESLWWEAQCVVSNVSMSFEPTQPVMSQIDFITTGEFQLKTGSPVGAILQQDQSFLMTDGSDARLSQDNP